MDTPVHPAASAPTPPSSSRNDSFGLQLVLLIAAFGIGFWLGRSQPLTEPPTAVASTAEIVYVVVSPTVIDMGGGGDSPTYVAVKPPTATVVPMPSPIPTLTQAAGSFSAADNMELMYVQGGNFKRGTDDLLVNPADSTESSADSMPMQTINVAPFYIDKYEVSNAMYAKCVAAGECQLPRNTHHADDRDYDYYHSPQYATAPVIFVTWFDADDYCRWAGRRLPTEAEWEKAARGWDDWNYPWGNDPATATHANFGGASLPMAAGSFPAGVSRYGAHDMAGNVAEWVSDRYSKDYYPTSPVANPSGPTMGEYRVFRGGSSYTNSTLLLTFWREGADEDRAFASVGFRCADSDPAH